MSLGTAIAMKRGYQAQGTILGKFLSAACIGVLLGLFVTFVVFERGKGFEAIAAGPWTGWPRNGTSDTDPYTRAILAYSGEMSLSESVHSIVVAQADFSNSLLDATKFVSAWLPPIGHPLDPPRRASLWR